MTFDAKWKWLGRHSAYPDNVTREPSGVIVDTWYSASVVDVVIIYRYIDMDLPPIIHVLQHRFVCDAEELRELTHPMS